MRPLLLDLFCGAGGAAMGYHRAGFDVIGVDIVEQPNYPFPFIQGDALDVVRRLSRGKWRRLMRRPSLTHASPPCQAYLALTHGTNKGREYPKLVEPTREILQLLRLPHVIESPMRWPLRDPIRLCGDMFGLDVIRHRFFESNIPISEPAHPPKHRGRVAGMRHGIWYEGPYFAVYGNGGGKGTIEQWQNAMGIEWMTTKPELAESIPPAFTEYIGAQLLDAIKAAA